MPELWERKNKVITTLMTTKMANFVKYATRNQIYLEMFMYQSKLYYKHFINVLPVDEYMANSISWLSKKDDSVIYVSSVIVNSLKIYLFLDRKDILCT